MAQRARETLRVRERKRRQEEIEHERSGKMSFIRIQEGTVDPRCPAMTLWDLNTTCLLIFIGLVTPFEARPEANPSLYPSCSAPSYK